MNTIERGHQQLNIVSVFLYLNSNMDAFLITNAKVKLKKNKIKET